MQLNNATETHFMTDINTLSPSGADSSISTEASELAGGDYPLESVLAALKKAHSGKQHRFTTKDTAAAVLRSGVWESDHFGFCTIGCHHEDSCPGVFYFNGMLR